MQTKGKGSKVLVAALVDSLNLKEQEPVADIPEGSAELRRKAQFSRHQARKGR